MQTFIYFNIAALSPLVGNNYLFGNIYLSVYSVRTRHNLQLSPFGRCLMQDFTYTHNIKNLFIYLFIIKYERKQILVVLFSVD